MASIAVAGSLAQRPGHGGHAWVFLNYLLGLRQLGHEVTFVDRLEEEDEQAGRWLEGVMASAGLAGDYVLVTADPASRDEALRRLRRTALLIDVNGYLGDEELREAPSVSAFLDIDPAIQQMWQALGQAAIFGRHDIYFTVGENVGKEGSLVPTCGQEWIPTRQPVVLERWRGASRGSAFTTLATWRGPYAPIEFDGRTFGLRVHEFRRFLELPGRADADFELALDIDAVEVRDIENLKVAGWGLIPPEAVAATPARYREFIHGSLAEISIPKEVYVASRCGWFSDRSACYLASGKPVITVDTGFSARLPTGEGLLCVEDVEAAAAACAEVLGDPGSHERAAREIAAEHFDSDRVLRRLLDAAGV
jgi:hypothetical protein